MTQKIAVIVVAAGRGSRAGGGVPKQYRPVHGAPVIVHALSAFTRRADIALVQPVIHADDVGLFRAIAPAGVLPAVVGAASRQGSVHAGLVALSAHAPDLVLVHDAARPFLSQALIDRAIAAAAQGAAWGAAVPVLAMTDSVVAVDGEGMVRSHPPREELRRVQTPQAFRFAVLLEAHRAARAAGRDDFTDDASLVSALGAAVHTFAGEARNVKLTTADDFREAEEACGDVRMGSGYDVHRFGPGTRVVLGGVEIPHGQALVGHSDADVGLHALTDAVLGALAEGDIGAHFPPSDATWRGASSDRFLAFACERVRARGGHVAHLDLTLVCEAPRIGPHREAMRARIAQIAAISPDRVAVKATTNERLGFIGRGEGIAAMACATVRLPWSTTDG